MLPAGVAVAAVAVVVGVRVFSSPEGPAAILRGHTGPEGPAAILRGHNGTVWSLAFSPDSKILASSGDDGTVRLWDIASRRRITVLPGLGMYAKAVTFSPDGTDVAADYFGIRMEVWDLATHRHFILKGENARVQRVTFPYTKGLPEPSTDLLRWTLPDGKHLAALGTDALGFEAGDRPARGPRQPSLELLVQKTRTPVADLTSMASAKEASEEADLLNPDGSLAVVSNLVSSPNPTLEITDLKSGRQLTALAPDRGNPAPDAWAFSPDSKIIAADNASSGVLKIIAGDNASPGIFLWRVPRP